MKNLIESKKDYIETIKKNCIAVYDGMEAIASELRLGTTKKREKQLCTDYKRLVIFRDYFNTLYLFAVKELNELERIAHKDITEYEDKELDWSFYCVRDVFGEDRTMINKDNFKKAMSLKKILYGDDYSLKSMMFGIY